MFESIDEGRRSGTPLCTCTAHLDPATMVGRGKLATARQLVSKRSPGVSSGDIRSRLDDPSAAPAALTQGVVAVANTRRSESNASNERRPSAGQDESAAGRQQSTELDQSGRRWLGELHRVHAHQPIRDARRQAGCQQGPDPELGPAGGQSAGADRPGLLQGHGGEVHSDRACTGTRAISMPYPPRPHAMSSSRPSCGRRSSSATSATPCQGSTPAVAATCLSISTGV
jgi:hypothetical protein